MPVSLTTTNIGLQLPAFADVKLRGIIVGEVREITTEGDGAVMTLAIKPEMTELIPANTSARILPKTLFGEKYVALQVPEDPQGSIKAGDKITESRVAIEVEKVLADLYPLLRTVQPEQLNYTLTAMATALEGRGEQLGNNLVVLDDYLERMNPKIPLLIDDLNKLATVSDAYTEAVPDLANLLRNSVTTGNTFLEKEAKVTALFTDVASFSSTSKDFLEKNGENIIRLSKQGQRQLPLFAKYAPEYPCLLKGMVNWTPNMEQAYRGYTLHIQLETLPNHPTGYRADEKPRFGARNGPHCERLPNPPYNQNNKTPQPRDLRGRRRGQGQPRQVPPAQRSQLRRRHRPDLRLRRHRRRAVARQHVRRPRDGSHPGCRPRPGRTAAGAPGPWKRGERAMKLLDKKTSIDAVKLVIFIVVTTIATSFLVVTIGNVTFSASKSYKAVFSDATGVVKGDDVRVAGVRVGNVQDVRSPTAPRRW